MYDSKYMSCVSIIHEYNDSLYYLDILKYFNTISNIEYLFETKYIDTQSICTNILNISCKFARKQVIGNGRIITYNSLIDQIT